jgi:hypothetical protein
MSLTAILIRIQIYSHGHSWSLFARKAFWADLYTVGPIPVAAQDLLRKTRRVSQVFGSVFCPRCDIDMMQRTPSQCRSKLLWLQAYILWVGLRVTKIASKAPRFFADSYWAVGLAIESCWLKKSLRLRSLPLVTSPHSQNIRIQP